MAQHNPPHWPNLLLKWICSSRYLEEIEGDLLEYYESDLEHHASWVADLNYFVNVIKFLKRSNFESRIKGNRVSHRNIWLSGLMTAFRSARRHRTFSIMNLGGLVLGISSCLILYGYVIEELSYDRYHQDTSRIYRITDGVKFDEDFSESAIVPAGWAHGFDRALPEIEAVGRINRASRFTPTVKHDNRSFIENHFIFIDSTLLNIFDYKFIYKRQGNPLDQPNGLIITREISQKYFGNKNPLGEVLTIDEDKAYEVTAVVEMPRNNSFQFDFAALLESPEDERRLWAHTFVKVKPLIHVDSLEQKLVEFVITTYGDQAYASRQGMAPKLQALTSIHHYSDLQFEYSPNSNIVYIYLFVSIGIIILFITLFNFINLYTANAATRTKEINIRKIVGALKGQVALQFLFEGLLYMIMALILSVIAVGAIIPWLNDWTGQNINVFKILGPEHWITVLGIAVLMGILASIYPASYLSSLSFMPHSWSRQNARTRSFLVVIQFALSTLMITGAIVIEQQLDLFQNKELGFNKESKLILRLADKNVKEHHQGLRTELLNIAKVSEVSFTQTFPGERSKMAVLVYQSTTAKETTIIPTFLCDLHFTTSLEIDLLAGRHLDDSRPGDKNNCLINEKTATLMGWSAEEAIGKEMYAVDLNLKGRVVGVTENFNFSTLHDDIEPVVMFPVLQFPMAFNAAIIKVDQDLTSVIPQVKEVWQTFSPNTPFDFTLLNDDLSRLYRTDVIKGRLFRVFVLLSVIISCLGLLGLTMYTLEKRTKEICVRKVLGGSFYHVFGLLTGGFLKLIVMANLIAFPFTLWLSNRWLDDFAYRIYLGPEIFAFGFFLSFGVAFLTIATLTVKKNVDQSGQSVTL